LGIRKSVPEQELPIMDNGHIRALEQILLVALRRGAKTIAFVAPEPGSGSGTCARGIAEILARADRATVLIDLTHPNGTDAELHSSVGQNREVMDPIAHRESDDCRYSGYGGVFTRYLLDSAAVRQALAGFFPKYDLLILNLPALLDAPTNSINPIVVAAACDQVFLVCQRGRLRRERFLRAMEMARSGGCDFAGIVNDESCYDTPGREIARLARQLVGVAPRYAKYAAWVERYSLTSTLLN
jgi:hypothetical protein